MSAWATNQMIQVGGMYRVRYTGKQLDLPIGLRALDAGMELTFAGTLDKESAENPNNYTITTWDLKRTAQYGSDRYNTKTLAIDAVSLSDDKKTLLLALPDIEPTWIMTVEYTLRNEMGKAVEGLVQNTVYKLESDGI